MLLSSINYDKSNIFKGVMAEIKNDCLYSNTNLWIKVNDNIARVGIDDYSQDEFGEIVYIELPKIGKEYQKDDEICVIESVKTASDIYAPLSGTIVRINEKLVDNPKLINESCYKDGWLFDIQISQENELKELLTPEDYKTLIE
ncbi:MAG: glycine cleavage system protein GcvH [Francisella sp.]